MELKRRAETQSGAIPKKGRHTKRAPSPYDIYSIPKGFLRQIKGALCPPLEQEIAKQVVWHAFMTEWHIPWRSRMAKVHEELLGCRLLGWMSSIWEKQSIWDYLMQHYDPATSIGDDPIMTGSYRVYRSMVPQEENAMMALTVLGQITPGESDEGFFSYCTITAELCLPSLYNHSI